MEPVETLRRRLSHNESESLRGITLVELMVVITILGLMAGAVTLAVLPELRKSKRKITLQEMATLANICEIFEVNYGRVPEALDELKNPPDEGESLIKSGQLKDAWGNEYVFDIGDDGNVRLTSYGSDRMEGGSGKAEDLVWPQEEDE